MLLRSTKQIKYGILDIAAVNLIFFFVVLRYPKTVIFTVKYHKNITKYVVVNYMYGYSLVSCILFPRPGGVNNIHTIEKWE